MDFADFLIVWRQIIWQELKYSELTGKIIGAAMKIHGHLGLGFPEIIYKRCLIIELKKLGLDYVHEEERAIYYSGECVGKRRLDLVVDNKILVELKAVTEMDRSCHNQIINYLSVFNLEIGLLLNFGKDRLEFKRFIN